MPAAIAFHARDGEHRAAVDIATLEVLTGRLPGRAMRRVREWGELHRVEFMAALVGPGVRALRDDPQLFAQVRVDAQEGTIVWPNGADLAPEMLYRESAAARTS